MSTPEIMLLGAIAGVTIFLGLPIGRMELGANARSGLSALATPLLALVAAAAVVRGRRHMMLGALALALVAALVLGRELSASIVTAFGCLTLGVALTRLIPRRWLLLGVVAMACLDVLLLAVHVGQPAAAMIADATTRLHGRAFDAASIGPITVDYPDLVLAAVLGGFCAGGRLQRRTALTLTLLAAAWGMLLSLTNMVPETPPIALTFVLVVIWERAPFARRRDVRSRTAAERSRPPRLPKWRVPGWAMAARLVLAGSRP